MATTVYTTILRDARKVRAPQDDGGVRRIALKWWGVLAPPRLLRPAVVNQGMNLPNNSPVDIKTLAKDLRSGHRAALARAITLIESRRGDHQAAARDLVQTLLPETGKAIRVGITGSPGVGKSTTIDVLGMFLIERGHKVAVLAVCLLYTSPSPRDS